MTEHRFAIFDTAIGRCGVAWGPRGINAVQLPMASEDKRAKGDDVTMRMLAPTLHYDGQLLVEMVGTLERFRALRPKVLLLGGSKGLAYLKVTLDAVEKVLPRVQRVEFPGLDHGGSSDTSNTNRGGQPQRVAQELRRFFA